MDEVKEILSIHFPQREWKIAKSLLGASKESYIAESSEQKLFIKFDVENKPFRRLGEIEVAPKVLAEGRRIRPYLIQEYIQGTHPEWNWFPENLQRIAGLIKLYQSDTELKNLLGGEKADYDDHVNEQIILLDQASQEISKSSQGSDELDNLYQMFRSQAGHLTVTSLVPTHADPNNHNFILFNGKVYLVDWDDVSLSDPMRDVGLVLFWYVPKSKWSDFFSLYGGEYDENRIYWWIAKGSLLIAQWFLKRHDKEKAKYYLDHFRAGVMKEENSQLV